MHELFAVAFVDGFLDDAPVAQIDASLGESAGTSTIFVIEGVTQGGRVSCHGLDDQADRGGRGRSAAASAPLQQVATALTANLM
jgi:hypothetical protein